jgi:hypothetical protein
VKSTLPPLLRHERGGYVPRQRQEDHAQRSHTRPGSAAAGPTDSVIGSFSRVFLANRSTFHHLVGELLGKRVGTARPGWEADDLIEHGSHIDIRSARLCAGAHSAQVCSYIGKRSGRKLRFMNPSEVLSYV